MIDAILTCKFFDPMFQRKKEMKKKRRKLIVVHLDVIFELEVFKIKSDIPWNCM